MRLLGNATYVWIFEQVWAEKLLTGTKKAGNLVGTYGRALVPSCFFTIVVSRVRRLRLTRSSSIFPAITFVTK